MASRGNEISSQTPDAMPAIGAGVCDRKGSAIDVAPIARLLERIVGEWRPEQIWLFGSRARGDASAESDWDLLIVLPDDLGDEALDPIASWQLRTGAGTRADLMPCLSREFHEDRATPNTLAHAATTEGVLLYGR